jgi:hypothetical protein
VVQAADFGKLYDPPRRWKLDRPSVGCILVEREVSASPMIVREVRGEDASEVPLAQNEHVIQALAPDGADEPFREGILPRALRCREDLYDRHAFHAMPELPTVNLVAVAEEMGRRRLVREGVHDLLGGPGGGGVLGDVEVDDAPARLTAAESTGRAGG